MKGAKFMTTLIKNGTIVTSETEYTADILIEGESIKAIGAGLDDPADSTIDAAGMYVLPGGVDQHTHFDGLNTDGETSSAGYDTSYVAALGGTTTVVDFAAQDPGKGLIESAMYRKDVRTKGKVSVDFGIHALCTNVTPEVFKEVPELPKLGIPTLKLFMAYKPTSLYVEDGDIYKFMRLAKDHGITMSVHAENADILNLLRDEEYAKGHTTPKYHYLTRPPFVEAEATQRAITLAAAAGCPLCVVHVTCEEAADAIRKARKEGKKVIGETCTHYLTLDQSLMDNPDFNIAARWVCSPAIRVESDREYLWQALRKDDMSIVASDHCGIPLWQKVWGKDDFRLIPNGSPGVGERLQMLWTNGVETGIITRQRLVQIYAATPAKVCGLYPRKGAIAIGSDADIVLYNPGYRGKIKIDENPTGTEYNSYEGMDVIGRPETVLLRGKVVVEGHKYIGTPGEGQFIPGEPYGLAYQL